MSWFAILAAVVSAHVASAEQCRQYQLSREACAPYMTSAKAPEVDLERLARERRARVEADTRKTMRDAKIGTMLLLALIVTAAYGCAQLLGAVP